MATAFRIVRITLREIRLELVRPFRSAAGEISERRILLTELEGADGTIAWGECVALEKPDYLPETIDSAWNALEVHILPRVLDRPFDHPSEVSTTLNESIRGHNMAKAAIEMPCWSLVATMAGQSLAQFIGGERSEVATGVVVGLQNSLESTVDAARAATNEGYSRIKLKIAPGNDVDLVAAVRDAIARDVSLSVDGNNAYTLDDLDKLRALDGFALQYIEQPLAWDDFADHAELQRQIQTPICLDESIQSLADAKTMRALGSARILNLKPGRVGGFAEAIAIHNYCLANDIPVWCGGMLESGIGRAYNVALASLSGFALPGDLSPSKHYWNRDVVIPEWTMGERGIVTVPSDTPGLGREVDREYINSLTVRMSTPE